MSLYWAKSSFTLFQGAYMCKDVFEDTAALCQRVNKQVGEVFSSPETVMAKLIQSIFDNKLQVSVGGMTQ